MKVCVLAPAGKSRSPGRSKQAVPPSASLELTVAHRCSLAKAPTALVRLLPVRNVKLEPAWSGVRLPITTEPPAGTDPTTTRGTVMQSTFGSLDDRMKLAPVRA